MFRSVITAASLLTASAAGQESPVLPNLSEAALVERGPENETSLEALLLGNSFATELPAPLAELHPEQLALFAPTALVAHAVSVFSGEQEVPEKTAENLRAGLRIAIAASDDPYLHSVAKTYLALPTPRVIASFVEAVDTDTILQLKAEGFTAEPLEGRAYPEHAQRMMEELSEQLRYIPNGEELEQMREELKDVALSDFSKRLLQIEGAERDPELVERAELELKRIVQSVVENISALREQSGPRLDVLEVLDTIHRTLKEDFGVYETVQSNFLDGLVTHAFDCDIHSLVYREVGEAIKLPVKLLLILDDPKNPQFGHCMPMVALQHGDRKNIVVYEPRSPIEVLEDGSERRVYRGPQEVIERVNRLAEQELLGEDAKPFVMSEANFLKMREYQVSQKW